MKIRDMFGWISIILFVVGIIAYIMRIGQSIEAQNPGSVVTTWIWLGTWGVTALSCLIIWIFDRGYNQGRRCLERQQKERGKSFMERNT